MPETYGLPEPAEPIAPRIAVATSEFVAGRGIVRTILLYLAAGVLAVTPAAPLALVPVILLMASDPRLG